MQGRIPGLQQTHAGADKVDWGLHGMLESLANNHISAKIRLQHKNGSMQGHIAVCHDTLCSVMLAQDDVTAEPARCSRLTQSIHSLINYAKEFDHFW